MITRLLNRLLPHKVIVNCDRHPYLHRWYLWRTRRVAIFIHKFIRSDEDRALHDHPWDFLVIPIWRGYVEHSAAPNQEGVVACGYRHHGEQARRVLPIVGARFRRGEFRHRVELIDGQPAWSVFFRFAERRTWGFWLPSGFMAWNKWWQEKCE